MPAWIASRVESPTIRFHPKMVRLDGFVHACNDRACNGFPSQDGSIRCRNCLYQSSDLLRFHPKMVRLDEVWRERLVRIVHKATFPSQDGSIRWLPPPLLAKFETTRFHPKMVRLDAWRSSAQWADEGFPSQDGSIRCLDPVCLSCQPFQVSIPRWFD